jgi:hypothetical protein
MNSPRKSYEKSLLWFRRDLRDFDHAALFHALKYSRQVFCVFVFDREILDTLPRQGPASGISAGHCGRNYKRHCANMAENCWSFTM